MTYIQMTLREYFAFLAKTLPILKQTTKNVSKKTNRQCLR